MLRAQGIKKKYHEEKTHDTEHSKVAPLEILLKLQYERYVKLCYWCYEMPLSYGKWLCIPIN